MHKDGRRSSSVTSNRSKFTTHNRDACVPLSDCGLDVRPHINIKIKNLVFSGLLDSGASVSCFGGSVYNFFLSLGFKLNKLDSYVTTADGKRQDIIGTIRVLVLYNNIKKYIKFFVIPSLSSSIVLGVDFWKQFDVAPQLFPKVDSNVNFEKVVNEVRKLTSASLLSPQDNHKLNSVIVKFKSISFEERGLGKTHLVRHKINTTGDPIKQRYYPLSQTRQKQLEEQLKEMLDLGVVRRSRSAWSNPVLIVPKKDGSVRFCLDSRRLNSVTLADSYPLPYISRILDKLRGARFISSIDLSKSFWQIPLDKESCPKTAFVVPGHGLFEFVRMPFGLKNAPSELQRLVDALFGPEFDENVFCYLDDLIIISEDFESHLKILNKIYERLRDAGLTVNLKKCEFCKDELKYLGYIVDAKGLRTDPVKLECIRTYPTPKNSKQIKAFIGLCGYYRRFIKDFSTIAAPLTKLTGSRMGISNFSWSPEAEDAFKKLKKALTSAPVISCPDFSLPFTIHCDASNVGIGGVLTQVFDSEEHPVSFFSRCLNVHERNYGVTERELLAVLDSVNHFRPYVEGVHFTVVTDHSSLQWLVSLSNPTGRLARWSTRLSQYSFDVVHRKGKLNTVPDVLSRKDDFTVAALDSTPTTTDSWYSNLFSNCMNNPQRFNNFQIKDNCLFRHSKSRFALQEDTAWKLVVPFEDRNVILSKEHESISSCHPGVFRTYKKVQLRYFWPGMYNDVKKFVNKCKTCKAHKINTSAPAGISTNPKLVNRPMQMLSIDLVGPLPRSYAGFMYILSVVDVFSKYTWIFPLRNATAKSIVKNVEQFIFLVHGVPQTFVCDNGKQFVSKEFKQLLADYNVPMPFYNAYYTPQNNVVERYNQTIGTALSILTESDHRNWSRFLPQIQSALNNTVNFATGFTPFFLMHGREQIIDGKLHKINVSSSVADIPLDQSRAEFAKKLEDLVPIYEQVSNALVQAFKKNAKHYNLRRKSVVYDIGDVVWRKNFVQSSGPDYFSHKLAPRFVRNIIKNRVSDLVYTLADMQGKIVGNFHVKDIVRID